MNGKFWHALFWTAAVYNFIAGAPLLLAPSLAAANAGIPPFDPQHIIIAQLAGLVVCLFGIGYAMVAMNTSGGRAIVILGLIGKLGVCALVAGHLLWGHVPQLLVLAAAGDFLFAIAFAVYLSEPSKAPAAA
ncbi:hypothetical protein [Parvibaculum sp.]|uniref:hypothetical protein n=1 Tax=Parvibaculum sp. TaxID=2024848 RepID=UPI001D53963D|nr:hypothetical protein [Parvibaculum sp.]MBX3488261.1 hypothetical protein [Parvibaculum sp.]MCW5727761.1 hypothetical protein [Parvibaculum sp.]